MKKGRRCHFRQPDAEVFDGGGRDGGTEVEPVVGGYLLAKGLEEVRHTSRAGEGVQYRVKLDSR